MYCGSQAYGGVIVHHQGCTVLSQAQLMVEARRPQVGSFCYSPAPDKNHDKEVIELLKRIIASLDALVERGNSDS